MPIFYNTIGDEIFMAKWKGLSNHANDGEILFSFKDNMVTVGDFENTSCQSEKTCTNGQTRINDVHDERLCKRTFIGLRRQ